MSSTVSATQAKIVSKTKSTKGAQFSIINGNPSKSAGSNNLTITMKSEDWRIVDPTVRMNIREARALRAFLNEALSDEVDSAE